MKPCRWSSGKSRAVGLGCLVVSCVLIGAASPPVLAQSTPVVAPTQLKPPVPGSPEEAPVIMNFLVMIVIVVLVVGAAFLPARRGHQD